MKARFIKIIGSAIVLVALGFICIIGVGVHARQTGSSPSSVAVTTNWVGYLVAGRSDASDQISPGPFPTTVRQVEIGLRSDGLVVWRGATKTK